MHTDLSYILMALFLTSGISAVFSMLVLQGRGLSGGWANRLRRWHRLSGYLFALFFLASLVGMLERLLQVRAGGGLTILHVALAVVLVPMLLVKIIVARWFKRLYPQLTGLGLAVFYLAVVLVVLPALVPAGVPENLLIEEHERATLSAAEESRAGFLLQDRCTRCHTLEKVSEAEMSLDEWSNTIARMKNHAQDPDFLSSADANILARYLATAEWPQ
jgi:hypothetical protein